MDDNTETPTLLSVVMMGLMTALVFTATLWLASGPEFGPRDLVGFILGVLASGVLLGQTAWRLIVRELAARPPAALRLTVKSHRS